jgi:hypothetical protein
MTSDPIIDEIKHFREQQAAKFNYDLRAIVADVQRRQRQDGRVVVRRDPRPPQVQTAQSQSGS